MTSEERRSQEELARRLAWVEWRLQWAEWKIGQLEKTAGVEGAEAREAPRRPSTEVPVAATVAEPQTAAPHFPSAPAPAAAPAPASPQPPDPTSPAPPDPHAPTGEPPDASRAAPTQPPSRRVDPPRPVPPPPAPFDWESLIGVRLFAWLGGAALFVAAALFLNYSIQQNLISPTMRVALGLVLGAAALLGGDHLRLKADRAGQAISGAGVATLYASLFAAHSLWHLIPSTVAFVGMVLVTVTAGVMAVKRDAFMLAVLGLLGGFLSPYLVSTGEDRPLTLFGYIALLDAGVVIVATRKRWNVLALLGVAGSGLVYVGWALKFMDAEKAPYALFAGAVLCALFALTTRDGSKAETEKPGPLVRVTASIAAVLPLVLALVVSGADALPIAPPVLVAYLLVLSAGAWFAGRRVEVSALAPVAAAFDAVTLAVRADDSLFPSKRLITLALFALVPVAWFGLWLVRRGVPGAPGTRSRFTPEERMLRAATTIALVGCVLLVVTRVGFVENFSSDVLPLAVYVWVHVALLVALGALVEIPTYLLGALAVSVASLLVLSFGSRTGTLPTYLPVILVPMVALWSLPFFGHRFQRGVYAWAASALALVFHFPFLYVLAKGVWSDGALGAASVGCGLLAMLTLLTARRTEPAPSASVFALVGGVALLFFTSAFPILLSNEWLTVAWSLEAAALAWLHGRVKHRGLLLATGLLGAATLLRLLVNPAVLEYHARSGTPILNWWLYTYGVSAVALLGAWWLLDRDEVAKKTPLPPFCAFAGGVLLFVLLNIEIADFYSAGSTVTFQFSGGGFQQDMTYTLAWGVFALALFGLGMGMKSKPPRIWAIVLVCVTVGKGSLHDVWALGSLYRVGAIVGLAFTLLAVSYLTQRFVLRPEVKK